MSSGRVKSRSAIGGRSGGIGGRVVESEGAVVESEGSVVESEGSVVESEGAESTYVYDFIQWRKSRALYTNETKFAHKFTEMDTNVGLPGRSRFLRKSCSRSHWHCVRT